MATLRSRRRPAPRSDVAPAAEEELREVLTSSTLFNDGAWGDAALGDVVARLVLVVVRSGDVVVSRGDASDHLHLVVSGRLRVVLEQPDGTETTVAEIGRGETVGEMGLITGDRRSATVYATRDTILARLDRSSFDALCARHPHEMMERFAGGQLRRLLQEARGERVPGVEFHGAVALVYADDAVSLRSFADELCSQLRALGPTLPLTPETCDALLGGHHVSADAPSAEDEAAIVRLLAEQERAHRFLVYEAGVECSSWSERCVRQSDHVIVLARAEARPTASPILAGLAGGVRDRRHTSLVLLHDSAEIGDGTAAAWSALVNADDVYHVRRSKIEDTARVARLVAGEAVSFVIGGGGARAFASIGVVRALGEAGCPIDTVGGASAGGMVAGLVAMDLGFEEAIARCASAARRVDYTIPIYALTTGRNWSATLTDLFGETNIEDLLLPYFCTSVNLSDARLVVHDRGSLLHAVRATTAIPGILPPVWHEGDLLVDGGLLNNLPVDVARTWRGVGRILAVSVTPERQEERREPFGYHVSGWRALATRLVRRTRLVMPTATDLLMRSMLVADTRAKRDTVGLADWVFRPPAHGYSLMDWQQFRGIAESGYQYASELLQDDEVRASVLGARS
jgi:predicted acylesterase/phospholipase RssA/CRP-like cAMP-binding protein